VSAGFSKPVVPYSAWSFWSMSDLRSLIRDVPDFPSPGILFRDITPLLAHPTALGELVAQLAERYRPLNLQKIIGIESRGFIFGAPLACALGVGFVPARKPGKLPYKVESEEYTLEYGSNTITMHVDAITPGERVLVIDDVIATGGTLAATCKLASRLGGNVVEACCIIELAFLNGPAVLGDVPFHAVLRYE
jgi:adenine phosphoribosyltransferase